MPDALDGLAGTNQRFSISRCNRARAAGAERARWGLGATRQELSSKRNTSELNLASRRVMSHSEALCRLTARDRRSDMIKRLLRRATYKFERDRKYDASYIRDMIDASPRT